MTYSSSGSNPTGSQPAGGTAPPASGSSGPAQATSAGSGPAQAAPAGSGPAAADTATRRTVNPPAEAFPGVNLTRKQKIGLAIGIIVAIILITLVLYFLFTHPVFTAVLRDILIIVLTFEVLVIGCLLAVLVYQIYVLSYFLYTEIGPVLAATQDTVGTVKGTATFVSGQVVNPAIRASATVTRWRRTVQVLLGK